VKKALVTGGSGFIGGALTDELAQHGYDVAVFDTQKPRRNSVTFIEGDVRDASRVRQAVKGCDYIFHLAGLLGTDYLCDRAAEAVDVNIHGANNVYEAARAAGIKVVCAGLDPEWYATYMITKKTAERFGKMYYEVHGADISTLELTHVYGPHQPTAPYRKAIPSFIVRALRGEPVEVFGLGQKIMDCVYVTDAAELLRLAAESPKVRGDVLFVGSGHRKSVAEIAQLIIQMTKSRSELVFVPMRSGEPQQGTIPDLDSAQWPYASGWKPKISLPQGLEMTINWYRENLQFMKVL
jgi:UDP-glucose 4-epimerase